MRFRDAVAFSSVKAEQRVLVAFNWKYFMAIDVSYKDLHIVTVSDVQWVIARDVNVAIVVPHVAPTLMTMIEVFNSQESK